MTPTLSVGTSSHLHLQTYMYHTSSSSSSHEPGTLMFMTRSKTISKILYTKVINPSHITQPPRPLRISRLSLSTSNSSPKMATNRADAEKEIKRNPHPDFKATLTDIKTLTLNLQLIPKNGHQPRRRRKRNKTQPPPGLQSQIDPYEPGRPPVYNYKLMISGIVPRPIGFISTRSADGTSTNLAPFSYFNMICHDPPLFTVGFAGGLDNCKDTLRNLLESKECCINIISEHFVEAANATSINAPYGESEWALSGLTPAKCTGVKCDRVKEAVFSIEGRLESSREFESKKIEGKKTGVLCVVEGTRFWVREDAVNEERNLIDPAILKPISRLGGITYGRTIDALEIPRPDYEESVKQSEETKKLVKPKLDVVVQHIVYLCKDEKRAYGLEADHRKENARTQLGLVRSSLATDEATVHQHPLSAFSFYLKTVSSNN
ncbi:hypothetical protein HYFRA_00010751 [Hymenoscyphus fraxineus]|uniref:Flavin reductase like domain-containing protein n=1 Tax=Hymenoscyphus fraxineus TaxID=746836 RepID=A0A9N9L366_9HELO|nr:hypothetical protein HYFRA_00010751 [Hymenoscyphus fraxineus]